MAQAILTQSKEVIMVLSLREVRALNILVTEGRDSLLADASASSTYFGTPADVKAAKEVCRASTESALHAAAYFQPRT